MAQTHKQNRSLIRVDEWRISPDSTRAALPRPAAAG